MGLLKQKTAAWIAHIGKNTLWALAVLMLAGVLLRAWGIGFGLPNDSRPDENVIVQVMIQHLMGPIVTQGDFHLNPGFFSYPSAYFYAMLLPYFIFYWWLQAHVVPPVWNEFLVYTVDHPEGFHLILRYTSVLCGTLMIPAMYAAAMQLLSGKPFQREAAWLSAVLMTGSYLMIRVGHFGGVDMPMTLFIVLALIAIIRFYRVRTPRAQTIAAVLAGVATGIKYPAAIVCVPLCVAIFKPYCDVNADRIDWGGFFAESFKAVGIALLAFLVTSPWVVLDVNKFWMDFQYEAVNYFGYALPGMPSGWVFYLAFALFYGVGAWVLVLALAGFWRALSQRQDYEHWIYASFLLAFYVLLGTNERLLTRYALPLVPVLLLYAALAVREGAMMLAEALRPMLPEPVQPYRVVSCIVLLGLMVLYQPLATSLSFDAVIGRPDTRVMARQWILQHVQPQPVGVGPRLGQIVLPVDYGQLTLETGPNNLSLNAGPPQQIQLNNSDFHTKDINTYGDLAVMRKLGVRYVVLYGGMPLFANPDWEFRIYQQQAKPVFAAAPLYPNADLDKDMGRFDVMDAFYLPYDKFDAFQYPGPNIMIFDIAPSSDNKATPATPYGKTS